MSARNKRPWAWLVLWSGVAAAWTGSAQALTELKNLWLVPEAACGEGQQGSPSEYGYAREALVQELNDLGVIDVHARDRDVELKADEDERCSLRREKRKGILEQSRSHGEPVDYVMFYSLSKQVKQDGSKKGSRMKMVRALMHVEILNALNGRVSAEWSSLDTPVYVSPDELRNQIRREVRNGAAEALERFKSNISVKGDRYSIELIGFLPEEVDDFVRQLKVPAARGADRRTDSELLHSIVKETIRLNSPLSSVDLKNRFTSIFNGMGVDVRIDADNKRFTLSREGTPYLWGYVSGSVLSLLLLVTGLLAMMYHARTRHLSALAQAGRATSGLDYLRRRPLPLMRQPQAWTRLQEQWQQHQKQAGDLCRAAEQSVRQGAFEAARKQLQEALALDADNEKARTLFSRLEAYEQGYTLFQDGKAALEDCPGDAIRAFNQARELFPYCADQCEVLTRRAETQLRQKLLTEARERAEAACGRGHPYEALSIIDAALRSLRTLEGFDQERETLLAQRARYGAEITPLTGGASGCGVFNHLILCRGDRVPVGRIDSGAATSGEVITTGFMRVSRLDRQCCFERRGHAMFLVAQESTNGTWFEGEILAPGQRVPLPMGESQLALGGARGESRPGSCRLRLYQPECCPGSVYVDYDQKIFRLLDRTSLSESWMNLESDLKQRWLLLHERFPLGLTRDGALDLGCRQGTAPLLYLAGGTPGLAVEPTEDAMADKLVKVAGHPLYGSVVLEENAVVEVGAHRFSFRRLAS